jgi:hypothetical protein
MRCPHCARVDATLVFRTRSGTDVWDLVVKLFVGIVAFLAVVVLIVGGHRSKKAAAQPTRVEPKSSEERQVAVNEIKDWARDLMEHRRRRLEG